MCAMLDSMCRTLQWLHRLIMKGCSSKWSFPDTDTSAEDSNSTSNIFLRLVRSVGECKIMFGPRLRPVCGCSFFRSTSQTYFFPCSPIDNPARIFPTTLCHGWDLNKCPFLMEQNQNKNGQHNHISNSLQYTKRDTTKINAKASY